MTHFLLLLQTVVEQLNANGVVYTPLKGQISEQGDDGSCPNARYEKKDFMSQETMSSSESSQHVDDDDGAKGNVHGGDYANSVDSPHIVCNTAGKRKPTQSISLTSSKRTNIGAKKGCIVKVLLNLCCHIY